MMQASSANEMSYRPPLSTKLHIFITPAENNFVLAPTVCNKIVLRHNVYEWRLMLLIHLSFL